METKTRLTVLNTQEEAKTAAAKLISEYLEKANTDKTPILFLSSGGSAITLLNGIRSEVLDSNLTVGVTDERYSRNPDTSNWIQLLKTDFYGNAVYAGCRFMAITDPQDNTPADTLTRRFDTSIRNWIQSYPSGKILATLGMGPDGHTAGIMPYPENTEQFIDMFDNPDQSRYAVSYDAGDKNTFPHRITVTCTFLRLIDYAVVYAVGREKKSAMVRLLSNTGSITDTPIRVIHDMKGVDIVTTKDTVGGNK